MLGGALGARHLGTCGERLHRPDHAGGERVRVLPAAALLHEAAHKEAARVLHVRIHAHAALQVQLLFVALRPERLGRAGREVRVELLELLPRVHPGYFRARGGVFGLGLLTVLAIRFGAASRFGVARGLGVGAGLALLPHLVEQVRGAPGRDAPLGHAGAAFELRKHVAAVGELHVGALAERRCDHRLVLNRVQGAGGIDEAATRPQEREPTQQDAQLERVETDAVVGRPVLPDHEVLAQCAVARAGHVSKDPVVAQLALADGRVRLLALPRHVQVRHVARVHVGHAQVGRRETLRLVHEHVRPLGVRVVGHHRADGHRVERVRRGGERRVDRLD